MFLQNVMASLSTFRLIWLLRLPIFLNTLDTLFVLFYFIYQFEPPLEELSFLEYLFGSKYMLHFNFCSAFILIIFISLNCY